jgi:hypothetical protein
MMVGIVLAVPAIAQESGLPAPPKPPKSKAAEAAKNAAADKAAAQSSPSDRAPAAGPRDDHGDRPEGGRLRRLRIDAPFFHMDLDLGSRRPVVRQAPPAEPRPRQGEVVPAPRADEMPAPRDGQSWRYRFHDGRWWYWLPSERWVYWQDGRWIEYAPSAGREPAFRIGEPRRGQVELDLEGVPPLKIGF